jgi:hypothetical protein
MAILDFPPTPQAGDTYIGDNGVTYTYDGVKWTGRSNLEVGYTGSLGYTGSVGVPGEAAAVGYTGSSGTDGTIGGTGYTGSQGDVGYTGSDGYTGSQGDVGYTGSDGYTGSAGSAGSAGIQGNIGFVGSFGYTGSQGLPGAASHIGYTGSAGLSLVSIDELTDVIITSPTTTGQILKFDGLNWINTPFEIQDDVNPMLGGNLNLNTFDIVGTGDINISGSADFGNVGIFNSTIESNGGTELILVGNTAIPGTQVRIDMKAGITTDGSILSGISNSSFLTLSNSSATGNTMQSGDMLSMIAFAATQGAEDFFTVIGAQIDPAGVTTANHLPSKFFVIVHPSTELERQNGQHKFLSFDCFGRLGVNTENATATLDVNGFAKLAILTVEPSPVSNGVIAIADGVSWNPTNSGKQTVVVRLGNTWVSVASAL